MTFETADAEELPYAEASFDVVLSTFGVMFAPDHDKSAAEMLRVCRPGGRIGLASWTPQGFLGAPGLAHHAFLRAGEELVLETRTREHYIDGHPGCPMHEGEHPGRLDESRRVRDAQFEAGRGEGVDNISTRPVTQIERDVDVRAEPGHAVEDGRLRAEQEPAQAQGGKDALELGE